jgi:hypothetical protein
MGNIIDHDAKLRTFQLIKSNRESPSPHSQVSYSLLLAFAVPNLKIYIPHPPYYSLEIILSKGMLFHPHAPRQ